MNKSIKNNNRNLLNLFVVALIIFMTFGCSGFMDGFKKGYKESTENGNSTSNSTNTSNAPDNSSTPDNSTKTETGNNLADDIVGEWEMTANGKKLVFEFREDKTVESFVDGKKTSDGTYSIIDEKTIETKNTDGSVTETIPVKIEGDKLTMTYNNTNLTFTKK